MPSSINIEPLRKWFLSAKRDLPWRTNPTPYAVWVSEVMLQQTQVAVVIPYFERWMARFSSIQSLAEAPLDAVIKQWEGLGYYSRARNLHAGAQYVVEHFGGELPETEVELKKIKGLGPYTIGAILSFAFHQKVPAVDGNVIAVLTRLFQIEGDIGKVATQRQIRRHAEQVLPDKAPWEITEGLIELGATVCKRQPICEDCPLASQCQARASGVAPHLPFKAKKVEVQPLFRAVAVIEAEEKVLIQRGQKGGIMSDLHEFPYFDTQPEGIDPTRFVQLIDTHLGLKATLQAALPEVSHTFTRYRVRLFPALFYCSQAIPIEGFTWMTHSEIAELAFSSGHRRILASLNPSGAQFSV